MDMNHYHILEHQILPYNNNMDNPRFNNIRFPGKTVQLRIVSSFGQTTRQSLYKALHPGINQIAVIYSPLVWTERKVKLR